MSGSSCYSRLSRVSPRRSFRSRSTWSQISRRVTARPEVMHKAISNSATRECYGHLDLQRTQTLPSSWTTKRCAPDGLDYLEAQDGTRTRPERSKLSPAHGGSGMTSRLWANRYFHRMREPSSECERSLRSSGSHHGGPTLRRWSHVYRHAISFSRGAGYRRLAAIPRRVS